MALGLKSKTVSTERTEKKIAERDASTVKTKSLAKPVSVSMPAELELELNKHSNEVMMYLMEQGVSTRSTKSRFIQELLMAGIADKALTNKIKSNLKKELLNKN